jgi:hypothetical protein
LLDNNELMCDVWSTDTVTGHDTDSLILVIIWGNVLIWSNHMIWCCVGVQKPHIQSEVSVLQSVICAFSIWTNVLTWI